MKLSIKNMGILFILLVFCFGLFSPSYAEEKFEIDIEVGFDGYVKANELTPVRIEVKNNYKDIDGKIEFLIHEKHSLKSLYTSYSKNINIAKGTTKIINLECIFKTNDLLYVRIVDKNGNEIFRKMVKYLRINNPNGMIMGIFSDDIDRLRYLSKIENMSYPIGNRDRYFEIAQLDDSLPENFKTLRMFQVIVINNYDTEKLNPNQRKALIQWIEEGGLLLVGTGPNYQKTLNGLENINFLDVKDTKEINVDKFEIRKALSIIDATVKEGEELYLEGYEEFALYHKELGKGNIIITGFDLGISPFVNWNGKDKFIGELINNYLSSNVENTIVNGQIVRNYWIDNIVAYLPYNLLPSLKFILIILFLFILLVGPVNYFILKKIDKRELLWVTIPMIVVLFSASIYILGFKTRLKQPIANNVSIIYLDNETNTANVQTKSGVMGFKNGDWDIAIEKNSEVTLDSNRNNDVIQRFADEEIVTEYYSDNENHVVLKKCGILDVESLTINREIRLNNNLVSEVEIKDDKLIGTIQNNTDLKLEDIIVFYGNKYEKLGTFKDNETSKKFEINISNISKNTANKDWYSIINGIYGTRGNTNQNNNGAEDILNNSIKRDILEGLFRDEDYFMKQNRLFVLAWNRGQIGDTIKVNGKNCKSIDRNLLIIPLEIESRKGEEINIPYGLLYPEIQENNNMRLEKAITSLYGDGYVVFRFKPQDNIKLTSMGIDLNVIYSTIKYDTYIYNFEENQWERINKKEIVIDSSNINKYYEKNRGTLIKIDPEKDTDIYMPTFSVKGVMQ